MIWNKVSDYCIKSGDWTIAKYNLKIGVKYGLYHLNESKGFFATADEAKASIEELK
jgi:hypothetical protein